jgi:HAD superfamily hydrolase (TIGR01450 family)
MRAAEGAAGYLVDLDGTLMSGRTALPGAVELVQRLGERLVIVSNDAEHTPAQLAGRLDAARLPVPAERIVLAGTTALELVAAEQPRARVMLLGSIALRRYARSLGLDVGDARPDVVVLARDRRFTYGKLMSAANAVRAGASLVVSNPDRIHPGLGGEAVPETGALAAAVLACTGPVPHRIVGKPEPTLFLKALALLGIARHAGVVVGDNPETDGAGALRLGLRYVRARSGVPLWPEGPAGGRDAAPDGVGQLAI